MLKLTRRVLCLDWDKRSLRIVVARIGAGKMSLEDAHSHRLPADVDADDPQVMGEFIVQMLRRHRLRFKTVLVDVPRERAVINRLTLPPTPESEVAAAVQFQAMRELPFAVDTAAVDYVITQRDERGLVIEVLLAAVTRDMLGRLRATCEAAGLTPTRIGLRPYANLVSARHVETFPEGRVLFVDVGPGATEIDVFDGDALAFARSANVNVPVPVSDGSREDSRIISLADIADLDADDEAIGAAVNELLVEVTRTLQAYRAADPEAVIDRVIVAGGTGIELQFSEALERRLGYPVKLYDPTEALEVAAGEADKLRSFSAALGLAWGLSREGLLALDFLSPKRPVSAKETLKRRARLVGLGAAVVVLAVAGGVSYWYRTLAAERDTLRQANNTLKNEVAAARKVQDQVDRAVEWEDLQAVWPDELLQVTQAAVEPGKQMLLQSIDLDAGRRSQRITLRNVHLRDKNVEYDFLDNLNGLRVGERAWYRAMPRAFTQTPGEFAGKLDIEVELDWLQKQLAAAQQREKERGRRK